ncbi:MAG: hypothetical protein MZV64_02690 [Ignavibacteriales bacterium]|nr:hypothetical protein [Ignavibacteriales bacterium]
MSERCRRSGAAYDRYGHDGLARRRTGADSRDLISIFRTRSGRSWRDSADSAIFSARRGRGRDRKGETTFRSASRSRWKRRRRASRRKSS